MFEGGQFESKAKQAQLYFLHDEELISTEVNDALEMVSFFLSKFRCYSILNLINP